MLTVNCVDEATECRGLSVTFRFFKKKYLFYQTRCKHCECELEKQGRSNHLGMMLLGKMKLLLARAVTIKIKVLLLYHQIQI